MALFRPTLGELSGSVGNATFSHSKSGATIRRRSVPTQPAGRAGGILRNHRRVDLAIISGEWAALTPNQQQEWINWATQNKTVNALGEPHSLSGHQAFVSLNTRRRVFNLAPVTTAPTTLSPAALIPTVATFPDSTHLRLTFSPATTPAANTIVLWQSRPHTGGKHPNRPEAVIAQGKQGATATPANWALAYSIRVGQSVTFWVETWLTATGQASVPYRLDLTR